MIRFLQKWKRNEVQSTEPPGTFRQNTNSSQKSTPQFATSTESSEFKRIIPTMINSPCTGIKDSSNYGGNMVKQLNYPPY
jgi:hypothetical protein